MRGLSSYLNESNSSIDLDKIKFILDKTLKSFKPILGTEVYIDDSTNQLVISVDELVSLGIEYNQIQKSIKAILSKYKSLSIDNKFSNDEVVFLSVNENLQEKAVSKSQRRLFAMALQVKEGDMKLEDIDPEWREQIQDLANSLTNKQLRDFAETKEDKLPERKD